MSISTGDILRCSARMSLEDGQDMVNVWHVKVVDDNSNSDEDILTDLAEWFNDLYDVINGYQSSLVTYEDITVYVEGSDDSFPPQAFPVLTVGGTVATALPDAASCLALLSTGTKRVVGRKYMGGFTEDDWIGAGFSPALLSDIGVMMDDFKTGDTMTLLTQFMGVVWSTVGVTSHLISSIRVLTDARYQRRRRAGAGS